MRWAKEAGVVMLRLATIGPIRKHHCQTLCQWLYARTVCHHPDVNAVPNGHSFTFSKHLSADNREREKPEESSQDMNAQ
jgi:hypothetical protein